MAYSLIDPIMTNNVMRRMSNPNYNVWGQEFAEIKRFLSEYTGFNFDRIHLTQNIGVTLDVLLKYFQVKDKPNKVYLPPNLGKETVDACLRSFGADNMKFYDFKNDLTYNLNITEDTEKNNIFVIIGTFYGVPVDVDVKALKEKGVFVIQYLRDNELQDKPTDGVDIAIWNFDRESEIFTNKLTVIFNYTAEEFTPLFHNGYTPTGKIIFWGYDLLPSLESQCYFLEKLKQIAVTFQNLKKQRLFFKGMLVKENFEIVPTISNFVLRLSKENLKIVIEQAKQKKVPNLIRLHCSEVYQHYPVEFPNNWLKLNQEFIVVPFGSAIPVDHMVGYANFLCECFKKEEE